MISTAPPSLIIYDTVTGRVPGGHQQDYLDALEAALAESSPCTFAPFRTGAGPGRWGRIAQSFHAFRTALDAATPTLVLAPNPTPLDFVIFALAAVTRRRRGRGRAVFVMRRDAAGITGPGWRAWVLEGLVRRLARGRSLFMVSDARAALAHWKARTGRDGLLVSIPVRAARGTIAPGAPPAVGLMGLFRIEKGGAHYDTVIEAALAAAPHTRVTCQLSQTGLRREEEKLARALLDKWSGDGRVEIHTEHLDATAFSELLHRQDIIILPYDVASYGPGTSGILFEAVAAGKIVLAAPIAWARQEYDGHPRVIWLAANNQAAIAAGMAAALSRVKAVRIAPLPAPTDDFGQSWRAAIARASGEES